MEFCDDPLDFGKLLEGWEEVPLGEDYRTAMCIEPNPIGVTLSWMQSDSINGHRSLGITLTPQEALRTAELLVRAARTYYDEHLTSIQ